VKGFTKALQLALAVNGVFAAALPVPEDLRRWAGLAALAAYVCVQLFVRADPDPGKNGNLRNGIIACILLGIVLGGIYFSLAPARTVYVNGHRYIKGTALTQQASEYLRKNPSVDEKEYLQAVPGNDPEEVWTADSIASNRLPLLWLYTPFTFLLAFGILGATELDPKPAGNLFLWVLLIANIIAIAVIAFLWLTKRITLHW
jgi:hypothetical protein